MIATCCAGSDGRDEPKFDRCCILHERPVQLIYIVIGDFFLKSSTRPFVLFLALWIFSSAALAETLSFGQRERIDHVKFGSIEFAVLERPIGLPQVVAFDSNGYLLAATPQAHRIVIVCNRAAAAQRCRIYDGVEGLVYEPEYQLWLRSRQIEMDDQPLGEPYADDPYLEYGFAQRPATLSEKLSFDAKGILQTPIVSLLSILWWSVACSFLARPLWRWKRARQQLSSVSNWSIVLGIVSSLPFWVMSYLATVIWSHAPYSQYFLFYVFTAGALVATVLARPKANLKLY